MKEPRYWVTLIYRLFLTYDEVSNEFKGSTGSSRVRPDVPSAEVDESKDTGETTKRRVPYRRAGVSKRL